jgi:hypothetical protein
VAATANMAAIPAAGTIKLRNRIGLCLPVIVGYLTAARSSELTTGRHGHTK